MKVLLASIIALTPASVLANEYQAGYSTASTCTRTEYREEYVPGTQRSPGYVKSWVDTIEVPCDDAPRASVAPVYRREVIPYDDNDCSDGSVIGALLGGGLAGYGSQGKGRWWAIPAGIIGGATIGCALDGG